jgi:SAM-dependent methyltransferase
MVSLVSMDNKAYRDIYYNQADEYQRLVAREDFAGHILPALAAICDLNGRVAVDLGTGTGRLIKLLLPHVAAVYGFDLSPAMLAVGRQELRRAGSGTWGLAAADHRDLPLSASSCDLILSGWSLCYLALDQAGGWDEELRQLFRRFRKMLRPGGAIIILETMGTGYTEPNPPFFMRDYFSLLEQIGMRSTWIRTDYQFESLAEAVHLTRFFFGEELARQVEQGESRIVPECTGIWWTDDAQGLQLERSDLGDGG